MANLMDMGRAKRVSYVSPVDRLMPARKAETRALVSVRVCQISVQD